MTERRSHLRVEKTGVNSDSCAQTQKLLKFSDEVAVE